MITKIPVNIEFMYDNISDIVKDNCNCLPKYWPQSLFIYISDDKISKNENNRLLNFSYTEKESENFKIVSVIYDYNVIQDTDLKNIIQSVCDFANSNPSEIKIKVSDESKYFNSLDISKKYFLHFESDMYFISEENYGL